MRKAKLYVSLLTVVLLLSCKQDGGTSLDILSGGGGPTNATELKITSRLPDQGEIIVEVGQSVDFFITGVAVFPRTVNYSWKLDNQAIAAVNQFTFTGTEDLIGEHSLVVTLSDEKASLENVWIIKVNGPPVISSLTTGIPKVSVDSTVSFMALATDPNNDSLTYQWRLNGAESPHLSGLGATGYLTGHSDIVGTNLVTVEVSDGTRSSTYSWNGEVNWFPQKCNELQTGQICTFAGSANKGSGFSPNDVNFPLRFRPGSHVQDNLGNFFISDLDNHVVWYWNNTVSPVTRVGVTIQPGTIQVIAGTGGAESGSAGISALASPLYEPRGLWYDNTFDRLYITEYLGDLIKYVDASGVIFVGMGGGTTHINGQPAFLERCRRPRELFYYSDNLYVTCLNDHRVKRWDLSSDLAYTVAGTGSDNNTGDNVVPTSGGTGQPTGIFVDDNGIYITLLSRRRIRFINTTVNPITFWAGNLSEITVSPGMMATIIGNGTNGATPLSGNPLGSAVSQPTSIWVKDLDKIFITDYHRGSIVFANNSPGPISIDGNTINNGFLGRINQASNGYNGSNAGIALTRFNQPLGISIDVNDSNRLIVSDYSNYRLRDINMSTGAVSDFLGSGDGKSGFLGDIELPVSQHLMNYPSGLVFDNTNQILFIADQTNERIRSVDKYGRMKSVVGSGPAASPSLDNDFPNNAPLQSAWHVTNAITNGFDIWEDGSLAQLNPNGHNVRVWNRSGSSQNYFGQFIQINRISTVAGDWVSGAGHDASGPALTSRLRYPNSVKFVNNNGNPEIYIVDSLNHCIKHVDTSGNLTSVLGTCETTSATAFPGPPPVPLSFPEASAYFNQPRDIAIDSLGNLFISDMGNHRIYYWNKTASPVSIGTVTVNPNQVSTVGCLGGTSGSDSENVLVSSARCNQPTGLALFGNRLCYAQRARHNVRCFNTTTGVVSTVAGRIEAISTGGSPFDFSQEGVAGTSATLLRPTGLNFDSNGDLYISDTENHIVRKLKLSP